MNKALLIISIVFLMACQPSSENNQVEIYDLDQEFEKIELSLSDIMEEPELVALETTEESILPGYFFQLIGEKYIITLGERILIFSRDGKFIKELARSGRGPGEYLSFGSYQMDTQEEYLYIGQYGKKSLLVYRIEDGSFFEIDVPDQTFSIAFNNQNQLLGTSWVGSPFHFYQLNPKSETIELSKKQNEESNTLPVDAPMLFRVKDIMYLSRVDSLYKVEGLKLKPAIHFKTENPLVPGELGSGFDISVDILGEEFIMLYKTLTIYSEGGVDRPSSSLLFIDRVAQKVYENNGFNYEVLEGSPRTNQNGSLISLTYDAVYWTENMTKLGGDASKYFSQEIIQASKDIDSEDNPILIIGKIK